MTWRAFVTVGILLCLAFDSHQDVARLGCAKDVANNRDLETIADSGTHTSQQQCASHCNESGFKIAGLQGGHLCLCGNSYGKHGMAADSECATKCLGKPVETCGGTLRNEILDATVLSTEKKLVLNNCRQSSNFHSSRCTGALDGNTNQHWTLATHSTTNNDPKPWWEASTDRTSRFSKIIIFNRQDCCPERLNNFVIMVDGKICARYQSSTSFSVKSFPCNMDGKTLRIESQVSTYLTLAEVWAFGNTL